VPQNLEVVETCAVHPDLTHWLVCVVVDDVPDLWAPEAWSDCDGRVPVAPELPIPDFVPRPINKS